MDFHELARARHSVKTYDPQATVSDETLRRIFDTVALSPSSFNLQHWRFVVVRDAAMKEKLQEASWNQPQVGEASAVILVCGRLDAHEDAAVIHADAPPAIRPQLFERIHGVYGNNPQVRRDEAIRSGSLAAMSLMYAAREEGYDTCPMLGFDPDKVSALLGVPENCIPVMLVVLGKCRGPQPSRRGRLPLADVVQLETMDGPGLA